MLLHEKRAIRYEKEIKELWRRKEESKLFLIADNMIIYLEYHKQFPKIFFNLVDIFNKIARYKINLQKSLAFYMPATTILRKKSWTTPGMGQEGIKKNDGERKFMYGIFEIWNFFVVLGFKLKTYTLSHSTNSFLSWMFLR
jgi:hypothetical protein